MTDLVIDDGAPKGNPTENPGGVEDKGQASTSDSGLFTELEDQATREWLAKRHNNDPISVAKQAFELDKFAGKAVAVPGEGATPEEWDKFYTRLGRPEKKDGYDLKVDKALPEDLPYDAEFLDKYRDKAFELGLRKQAAEELHSWFVGEFADKAGAMTAKIGGRLQETIDTANETLEAKWGAPDGETFKTNLELSGRFFSAVDENGQLLDRLNAAGLVGPQGEILVPELAFAFAKAGAAIFTEGRTLSEGNGLNGANPFEGDVNLTEVMKLAKEDPQMAVTLAKAAGKNPADYGLNKSAA